MSCTAPLARRIIRREGRRWIPLSVIIHVQAALLIHDFRERVSRCKCHTRAALTYRFHLKTIVVGIAVIGFRPDAVPVQVAPCDVERVARRGRARPEAVRGRGVPGGIPLLPIYDFIVWIIELDVAREMPALGTDIRDFHHAPLTYLLLDRKTVIVFGG